MSTAFRRIARLQRRIHQSIRAEVRKVLGPQSREIRRYYDAYKREFHGPSRTSSKDELLAACRKADIILIGDYHTFAQSQRAALRLLRDLVREYPDLGLGMELVRSKQQHSLSRFVAGAISESDFLSEISYGSTWGFPWENYKPLFLFAQEHGLETLGLNIDSPELEARDSHAAELIASWTNAHPGKKLLVLYGDLHLARGHLPKQLSNQLKRYGIKRRVLTIFQNSETLFWRVAQQSRSAHSVDVLALSRNRFCVMNASPWVKLQSYLEWAEANGPLAIDDSDEQADGPNLHEVAHERLKHLIDALQLPTPKGIDFTIQSVDDLSFLTRGSSALGELTRLELKTVKYRILGNRCVLVPKANIIYLPSSSVNSVSEGVSMFAHHVLSGDQSLYPDPDADFFGATVHAMLAYFGSKVLNHKRKCDLEEDFRRLLATRMGRGALPQERLQRKVARHIVKICGMQRSFKRTKRYRAPQFEPGPNRIQLFLETTRCAGAILGEKLYASFLDGKLPQSRVHELYRCSLSDTAAARKVYLELVTELAGAPVGHSSKSELL